MTRPRLAFTPPTRNGVGPSRVAVPAGPWPTVLAFLQQRLPAGGDWLARLNAGEVLDAQGRPVPPEAPAQPGAVLWYWRSVPLEPVVPFELELLHQDEQLVVVDKPHFLSVAPGGRHLQQTVLVRLKRLLGIDTLVPLHRLDLETAGVLAFGVQPAQRAAYLALWRGRQVHKLYEAVAPWQPGLELPTTLAHRLEEPPGEGFMQMQVLPGEPNARLDIALLRRLGPPPADWPGDGLQPGDELALYELQPHNGRKHQLRAQLNAVGLPIRGDRIYPRLWPATTADAPPDFRHPLQLLARELAFTDPVTGQQRRFTSRRQLALALC